MAINENVKIIMEYSAEMLNDYEVNGKGKNKEEWFIDAIQRKCNVAEAEARSIAEDLCAGISAYRQEAEAAKTETAEAFMKRNNVSDKDCDALLDEASIQAERILNDLDDTKKKGGRS